jgi:hypothetical protein
VLNLFFKAGFHCTFFTCLLWNLDSNQTGATLIVPRLQPAIDMLQMMFSPFACFAAPNWTCWPLLPCSAQATRTRDVSNTTGTRGEDLYENTKN